MLHQPPYNSLIEQQLIGCLLYDNNLIYELEVTPELLHNKQAQLILKRIKTLWSEKKNIEVSTIFTDWIDYDYLIDCQMSIMTPSWYQTYQDEIKKLYIYRELMKKSFDIASLCHDQWDILNILKILKEQIDLCAWDIENKSFIEQVSNTLDDLWLNKSKIGNFGLRSLDRVCNWYKKWQLIIIWSRPKIGKTSMLMTLVDHAVDQWLKVWAYILEMTQEEMAYRYISKKSKYSVNALQSVESDKKVKIIETVISGIWPLSNLYIRDNLFNISAILHDISRQHKKEWIDIVFIDYLWLIKWFDTNKQQLKTYEIQEITNAIKRLAKELWIAIVLFVQISRESEKNSRPTPANLRDSWAIEQDADVVILLHRDLMDDAPYKWDINSREMEVIVALQRSGPTDVIELKYHLPSMTLYDI